MHPLPWHEIDTLLLDLDGTLLDLHFDNHFWREHVPLRYAERHGMDVAEAKDRLVPLFRSKEGTMQWYCVDYWSEVLDLDIAELKAEVDHLIAVHPHVIEFLDAARAAGKRVVLVTNAHQKALDLKLRKTRLGGHLDRVICAHAFGRPKEDEAFWHWLQAQEPFDPARTLFIDDSLPVLRAAADHGIRHLLAVRRPDTRGPEKDTGEFAAIDGFEPLVRQLQENAGVS
ncbi:MAG: GMP/IMP nucleotidase [Gammaproteobacteria bacterium]|nr:MAG: GMP/IMP nucleotidase [Gammaproteobacteria bacterium]